MGNGNPTPETGASQSFALFKAFQGLDLIKPVNRRKRASEVREHLRLGVRIGTGNRLRQDYDVGVHCEDVILIEKP
jgi:hypothetical protein